MVLTSNSKLYRSKFGMEKFESEPKHGATAWLHQEVGERIQLRYWKKGDLSEWSTLQEFQKHKTARTAFYQRNPHLLKRKQSGKRTWRLLRAWGLPIFHPCAHTA